MLAGEPPHMGNSAQQIIMKVIADPARSVSELRKSVPPNVAAAVAKALEKLPADRFESAAQFAKALANPAFTGRFGASASANPPGARTWNRVTVGMTTLAASLAALLLASVVWRPGASGVDGPLVRFALADDPSLHVQSAYTRSFASHPTAARSSSKLSRTASVRECGFARLTTRGPR